MIDENVVESVIGSPRHTFGGEFLCTDLAEMAACYLFGFATTQGFRDGNKRTAAVCTDVFLSVNGFELVCSNDELYDVTMRIANKLMGRAGAASWIRANMAAIPDSPAPED